jgi:Peptidase family M48
VTGGAGVDARAVAGPMLPWLWIWLIGDLAVLIPAEISDERYLFATYTGHGDISARLTAGTPYKLLFLFAVLAGLTYAVLAVGAVAALFPHLRGRWVERRFRLAASDQAVVADMQRYVSCCAPSVQLRVAISNGQMARIYPVGWRRARIAVFLPLIALWERDRPAAQAILLHEAAHYRNGDQLAVGLGSPFVWLIRIWVPAFLLLVVSPVVVYFTLGGGLLAQAVSGQGALQLTQPASLLILPVTALWLAELNADALTARITGMDPLLNALRTTAQTPASVTARALTLLSHPPLRLRVRSARPRLVTTILLLAAWPTALIAQLAVLVLGTLTAELLIGQPLRQTSIDLAAGIRLFLLSNEILIIAVIVLLLLWPVLSRPWDKTGTLPRPGWGPYLAAAAVPAALLGLSFAPLPASFAPPARTFALMEVRQQLRP